MAATSCWRHPPILVIPIQRGGPGGAIASPSTTQPVVACRFGSGPERQGRVGHDGGRDDVVDQRSTAVGDSRARSGPRALRAALRSDARRHGRRRDQDRAARRRSHPVRHPTPTRPVELLRPAERGQAQPQRRPRDSGGRRDPARPRRARRHPRRELSPGRDGAARTRRRHDARSQPAADLRIDLRLRPDRAVGEAPGVRAGGRSRVGNRGLAGQRTRRRVGEGPAQPRRPLHRARDRVRDPRRALPARTHRRRTVDRRVDGRDDVVRQRAPPRLAVGRSR